MNKKVFALVLTAVLGASGPASAADLVVAWKGFDEHKYEEYNVSHAAEVLATYMGKVTGKTVPVVPWDEAPADADQLFLLTETKHAPAEFWERLKGKRRDAFIIKYPVEFDGRKNVCLLVTRDNFSHDFSAYHFLTEFMEVHWVGPGELGEVIREQPDWQMPETIDLLFNPDFEHRFWHMTSFRARQWLARSMRMSWHHALGRVFDPNKYGKTHPEVYPVLANGKRYIPTIGGKSSASHSGGWQPCTSHPKSVEIATQYVLEALKKMPQLMTASLSVNDGAGNTCHCERCRALDPPDAFQPGRRPNLSERFYTFYNQVAERVAEVNPEAQIGIIAYGVTKEPPQRIKVHPNIQVFHVCPTPELLTRWAKAGCGVNLHLWLYDGGYLIVRPDMKMIAEQLRIARATGGIGVYSENIAHWPSCGPRFYVFAHLLRDVDREVGALYAEYFSLTYGPDAAPHVQAYYQRWDEVFNRLPLRWRYYATRTWRKATQFDHLRRDDMEAMDAALARAEGSQMSEKQRQRFGYLETYSRWLRVNAEQVLLARELADPDYVNAWSFEQLVAVIRPSLKLAEEFNRIWTEQISVDKTGWLMDENRQRRAQRSWDLFTGQLRMLVASRHDTAIDEGMRLQTERKVKESGKEGALAWLEEQMKAYPDLAPWIGPQVNRMKGVATPNIVPNGNFEKGTAGKSQPKLPGWLTYQDYGMMKGTKNEYAWGPGTGRDGGHAIGLGSGDYAELRTAFPLEEGARYRLSFWYRSENREGQEAQMWIFHFKGSLDEIIEFDAKKMISRFMRYDLLPTGGKWEQFTCTFVASRGGNFLMQPAGGRQKPGQWVWFDDIEIRKLW